MKNSKILTEDKPYKIFTLSSWSASDFPLNNGSFDNSSAIMHPNDHISIAVEYCFAPNRSSGALRDNIAIQKLLVKKQARLRMEHNTMKYY